MRGVFEGQGEPTFLERDLIVYVKLSAEPAGALRSFGVVYARGPKLQAPHDLLS